VGRHARIQSDDVPAGQGVGRLVQAAGQRAPAPLHDRGRALSGDYVVVRHGTFVRRTVALRRGAIVGFTGRQSYAQRRAGLFTLTATTAAGKGAVRIRDVDVAEGLRFAEAALPGLVAPFRAPGPSPAK
ncbi:PH domain-containing protein, partial [Streptomyces spectabilis]|uniref:PH domain-containing protein n=1 Tax=Streptomyces spectabilis TaxID=68270 RepID=UPI0033E5775B